MIISKIANDQYDKIVTHLTFLTQDSFVMI